MVLKRTLDIFLAMTVLIILFPLLILIAILVRLETPGPALHWSKRIGKNNSIFLMPKFRTMRIDTPDVATHLLKDSDTYITRIGRFLRKTSIDELPQLLSVVAGNMSLVGPRPALHNQDDLIQGRTQKGVHTLTPGVTGWAQINGRDDLSIPQKIEFDAYYLKHENLLFDLKVLGLTFIKIFKSEGISH